MIRSDRSRLDEYVRMYVDICKKVHSIHTNDPEIPSFKEQNRADIANIRGITEEERTCLHRFLDLVPDGSTCIHGDLNINNIMVQDGECCLIDMGELSTGTPLFDLSRIVFSMVYANTAPGEFNGFYKMTSEEVTEIYEKFFCGYFGCRLRRRSGKVLPGHSVAPSAGLVPVLYQYAEGRPLACRKKGTGSQSAENQASSLCACPSRKIERSRSHRRPSEGRCIAGEPELPV